MNTTTSRTMKRKSLQTSTWIEGKDDSSQQGMIGSRLALLDANMGHLAALDVDLVSEVPPSWIVWHLYVFLFFQYKQFAHLFYWM